MYEEALRRRLPVVEERIAEALRRSGRSDAVGLVAVTKGHSVEAVRAAVAAGIRRIGENRVQELESKRAAWDGGAAVDGGAPVDGAAAYESTPEWHLIGHLQRNKARRAIALCDVIESVDSLRLAQELSKEAERGGAVVRVLIQVNVSGEASKGGFDARQEHADQAVERIAEVAALPGLRVEGLMTMAPLTDDEAVLRATFRDARRLLERCGAAGVALGGGELSMGMSSDFEIAIEEGSTMIRLGTVLFGERQP